MSPQRRPARVTATIAAPPTAPAHPRGGLAARWSALRELMGPPTDQPALLKAQYMALAGQTPLMYLMLVVNTWLLLCTGFEDAPRLLTVAYPCALTLACTARAVHWLRVPSTPPRTETARRALHQTSQLAALLGAAFLAWALALFPYGDPMQQAQVAFFIAVTLMGCTVCMLHVRRAMLTVAITANVGAVVYFFSTGVTVFIVIGINTALASLVLVSVLLRHYGDFTRLVDAQQRAEALNAVNLRQANEDSLTRLPNRRAFFASLEATCARAQRDGRRFAVGVLDLDGFKPVNDLYGHAMGDRLLDQVGRRMLAMAGGSVYLARLGGDEFALIIEGMEDEAVVAFGQHLCATLRTPFHLHDTTLQVAATIGLVIYPDLATTATDLYERADYALYHGKRTLRGSPVLFSAHHSARLQQDATIEQALRRADFERELSVVFQPIVDIGGEHTMAFEALARWSDPNLGAVSPAQFIPVAERAGMVSVLTRVLLTKALTIAKRWPAPVRLSFNLSTHDLSSADNVEQLVAMIRASGFEATRLDLEITETAVMHDMQQVRWAATQLRDVGCGVTLDDFGTGFSSLSQLHALPLTKIKIDRSFVSGLQNNPASYKIVKSLLALSRDMALGCVVEGVETTAELATLRALGGSMVQGYLYAAPMSAAATEQWLAEKPALASTGGPQRGGNKVLA